MVDEYSETVSEDSSVIDCRFEGCDTRRLADRAATCVRLGVLGERRGDMPSLSLYGDC